MILVQKNNGEKVPFDKQNLFNSLSKSGATVAEVEEVYADILKNIYNGITTRKLYQLAFQELKKHRSSYAARYSLKKALRDLGPDGYYFEEWIAKLFQQYGYEAVHGITLQGSAVTHEIDMVAVKENELNLAECKFRNDIDAKISVTTPMYFLSRFNDLKENNYDFFGKKLKPAHGWIITNAYLTSDTKIFSDHYGIKLISWDYPVDSSIKRRVDSGGLYPITCLTNINTKQKRDLLSKGIFLVKEFVEDKTIQEKLQLTKRQYDKVLEEAWELLDVKYL